MADERKNLTFHVGAKDDASAVFSKASRGIKSELKKVDDALDDTATAGKRAADIIGSALDELETELVGTERVVGSLVDKLGPEFANKTDGIEILVGKLRNAGLSFEEIEADVDAFAAAIKRADDITERLGSTTTRSLDDVDGAVRRVGDSTDRTGSVVANFAGNAAQDIPGVSGAFGALNVAVGQFAEYAAEGGISLGKFVKAIGPIALATVIVSKVGAAFQASAEQAEKHKEAVADLVEAIGDGEKASDALLATWRELGKVEATDVFGGTRDITRDLQELGLTGEQFAEIAARGREAIGEWARAATAAGAEGDAFNRVLESLITTADTLGEAEGLAAVNAEVLADATDAAAEAAERATEATDELVEAMQERRTAADEQVEAIREQLGLEIELQAAMRESGEGLAAWTAAVAEHGAGSAEAQVALEELVQTYLAEGAAARENAENAAVAAGRRGSAAQEGAQAEIEALLRVAQNLAPGSPYRQALEDQIAALGRMLNLQLRIAANDIGVSGNAAGPRSGARASGGPVSAGSSYLVGERGPELFTPAASGAITPNDKVGGYSPTFNLYGLPEELVAEVERKEMLMDFMVGSP